MNFTTIAFSKGKLLIPETIIKQVEEMSAEEIYSGFERNESNSFAVELQGELMRYGKILDEKTFKAVSLLDRKTADSLADSVLDYLKETYGDNGTYVTLFGNFPHTVLTMPEYLMFLHTIVHYLSDGQYVPSIESVDDAEQFVIHQRFDERVFKDEYKKISYVSKKEVSDICKNICSSQQSLSEYDKKVVEYFCKNYKELTDNYTDCFPEKIPFKETLCIVASKLPEYKLQTVTDVLRLAAYISDIDISLPAIPKTINYGWRKIEPDMSLYNFKKFKRHERRYLLSEIENIFASAKNQDSVLAEMKTHLNKWLRLGEILHPGEFKNQFPQTFDAFDKLRNAAKYIKTFYAQIDMYREKNDLVSLLKVLSTRPGEFARNIDWVLRKNANDSDKVINAFKKVLPEVSMKVLYELAEHFNVRNDNIENRMVFLKAARKPVKIKNSVAISDTLVRTVMSAILDEIKNRFATKETLKGQIISVDEDLMNIPLPTNMRSASAAVNQLPRGTKLKIKNDTGLLRLYCRWEDKDGTKDIDLSCILLKQDGENQMISWNSSYGINIDGKKAAVFSGDTRHRKGFCAEYIDLNVELLKKAGWRYVVANANDFDGAGFSVKDTYAGIMSIDKMDPGKTTWYPANVDLGFKVTSPCTNVTLVVVDLYDMKMYLVDEDTNGIPVASVYKNRYEAIVNRYVNQKKVFNCFNTIVMNAKARGAIVVQCSHDVVLERKAQTEKAIQEIKTVVQEIHLQSHVTTEMLEKEKVLMQKYAELEKLQYITYDDIAASYTNIFEWMF